MRKYIRHPTDIPLDYRLMDVVAHKEEYIHNISEGGLSFSSKVYLEPGSKIQISIPIRDPIFEAEGVVMWCRKIKKNFDTGVQFSDMSIEFAIRMVEQVCHIEHYKAEVLEKEGRKLTGKEAAKEWIMKYAKDFPK